MSRMITKIFPGNTAPPPSSRTAKPPKSKDSQIRCLWITPSAPISWRTISQPRIYHLTNYQSRNTSAVWSSSAKQIRNTAMSCSLPFGHRCAGSPTPHIVKYNGCVFPTYSLGSSSQSGITTNPSKLTAAVSDTVPSSPLVWTQ
jgi:hypothetical protein